MNLLKTYTLAGELPDTTRLEPVNEPLYSGARLNGILARVRNNGGLPKVRKCLRINWSRLKEATAVIADASAVAQLLGAGAILGSISDQLLSLLAM